MQLIHDTGAHLRQPMPVPQQLPQIAVLGVRYPDPWEAMLDHQAQQKLYALTVGFLLAHSLRAYLCGVADPQLKLQVSQQPFKPACMPARFHPHTPAPPLESAVKLLGFFAVS